MQLKATIKTLEVRGVIPPFIEKTEVFMPTLEFPQEMLKKTPEKPEEESWWDLVKGFSRARAVVHRRLKAKIPTPAALDTCLVHRKLS
eukprot:10558544-Lingulodinium_polyedra.AAC.1